MIAIDDQAATTSAGEGGWRRGSSIAVSFAVTQTVDIEINAEDVLPTCNLMVYHRPDGGDVPVHTLPVNLLQLINKSQSNLSDHMINLKLEKGRYDMKIKDCPGYEREAGNWEISSVNRKWEIEPCVMQEMIEIVIYGGVSHQMGCDDTPQRRPAGLFRLCKVEFPAASGSMVIRMCKDDRLQSISLGNGLIDPDGYVYNAAVGLSAKIRGAQVTCDLYDEDTALWSRWPAELFESQINPQTTAADGYYAFFVPLASTASTPRRQLPAPRSPVIQVIDEIVHYNVPLQRRENLAAFRVLAV